MAHYQAEKLWQKILYSRPMIALLILVLLGLARALWLIYPQAQNAKEAAREAASAYQAAVNRETSLEAKVKALNTERGREALIREKFPVVKEGEHVITVIPAPTEPATN
jgi:cell division protein FtsB